MERRIRLDQFGKQLWTRDLAREIRSQVVSALDQMKEGDALVIDAKGVEVFDYSFANELFGRTMLSLRSEYEGRFVLVENLTAYTLLNLVKALEGMGLTMIEKTSKGLRLIGKVHPADEKTFGAIAQKGGPVTAAELSERLKLALNATNERLTKLARLGLLRRERSASPAGREQYEYTVPA